MLSISWVKVEICFLHIILTFNLFHIIGVDVNIHFQDEWTPLLLAVSIGNYEVFQELLKHGATINSIRSNIY